MHDYIYISTFFIGFSIVVSSVNAIHVDLYYNAFNEEYYIYIVIGYIYT